MKKFLKGFIALSLGLAMVGCAKEYDDTALKSKVDELSSDVNTLKAQQKAMQAVIDVWKAGGYIASIDDSVPGQHTITFYGDNGKVVVLYDGEDGEDGDAYFKSIVTDENGVTFTLNDEEGTSFTIPFAKAFKLVIENTTVAAEDGAILEFPYTVNGKNNTTEVDAFASDSYNVKVTDEKVIVSVPNPAVPGKVLVWAQNGEGLFSMVKLNFTVEGKVTVVTKEEDYQTIGPKVTEFVIDAVSNVDIKVDTPAETWLSVVATKADYKLTLTLEPNTTNAPREATLIIRRTDDNTQVQSIKIVQLCSGVYVTTLWQLVAPNATTAWTTKYLNAASGSDRNIAIDGNNVYFAEFAAGSKNVYAIDIAKTTSDAASYKILPNTTITGDGANSINVSCTRVIKKNNGDPVLVVGRLGESDATNGHKLYVYDNGVDNDPSVITYSTWNATRFGDTFTLFGTYEKCLMFTAPMNPNGIKTIPFDNGLTKNGAWLHGSLATSELDPSIASGFAAYYPVPDDPKKGVLVNRGWGRWWSITTTDDPWTKEGALTITATRLPYLSTTPNTDAATSGYNFVEFKGKRYVIYATRLEGFKKGYLVVKQGALTDDWISIATKAETVALEEISGNNKTTGNGSGCDVAVWQKDNCILIAMDMQEVGLACYRLTAED